MNGASSLANDTCHFRVWAPGVRQMGLRLIRGGDHVMTPEPGGYFSLIVPARGGDRYFYLPEGHKPVPDPVSRLLPEGVHGPTEIVDPKISPGPATFGAGCRSLITLSTSCT